jgi:hypothetical protein
MTAPVHAALALGLAVTPALGRNGFIELRDGRKVEGRIRLEPGRVVVVNAAVGYVDRVAFTNVVAMTFESGSIPARPVQPPGGVDRRRGAAEGALPPGWQSRDVGQVGAPGRVEAFPNYVRLHSGGRNVLDEADSFYFVFKQVEGDTEIVARVTGMESVDIWARAGLMIREELTANARGVFLGTTDARGTAALWRSEPGEAIRVSLARGGAGPEVGRVGIALQADADLRARQMQAAEKAFHAANRQARDRDQLKAAFREFHEAQAQIRRRARPWAMGEAPPAIREERVSAPAWLRLQRREDTFNAYVSGDGSQWSLVDRVSLPLGRSVYVGLAATGYQEWVSMVNGTVRNLGRATFQEVEEGPYLWSRFAPEVELRSGTVLRGYVGRLDDTMVHFAGTPARAPVRAQHVANIRFQAVPVAALKHLRAGVPGVVLSNGDFVEGDCRGITAGRVTISSVPLGLRSYDLNFEAAAVVFAKPGEGRGVFEARTSDGARWTGTRLECGEAEIILDEPLLGRQRLSVAALTEWRRRS